MEIKLSRYSGGDEVYELRRSCRITGARRRWGSDAGVVRGDPTGPR